MKKTLFTLLLILFMIPGVNADSIFNVTAESNAFIINNNEFIEENTTKLIDYYNTNLSTNYPYYLIALKEVSNGGVLLILYYFQEIPTFLTIDLYGKISIRVSGPIYLIDSNNPDTIQSSSLDTPFLQEYTSSTSFFPYYYYSNFDIILNFKLFSNDDFPNNFDYNSIHISNFYDDEIILKDSDILPPLERLLKYNSWTSYMFDNNSEYITVDLDNYEYVILNLKNYAVKDSFETNMQVKGSVAITPVYEFGTVEKEYITDLCNTSYTDFTDYRFFILKNDLLNNAVYIVKECQGSGSSFKYDSSVFDITYVTADNVDDPVVTFGGVDYHTIPFNKLSNTVNKNEEENFIPGESNSSLSEIIDNASNFASGIWNSISSFMGLVTKFFNTLPEEFRALTITGFTVLITITIIKFLKS